MKIENDQLYTYLLEHDIVEKAVAEPLFARAQKDNRQFADVLVCEGILDETQCMQHKAIIIGYPFVDLKAQRVAHDILALIPRHLAQQCGAVVFAREGETAHVAMVHPEDTHAIALLTQKTGYDIVPYVAHKADIHALFAQYADMRGDDKSPRAHTQRLTYEKIGLQGEARDIVDRAMHGAQGMIVVAGPAQSGKTTTLYTMLDVINTPDINISTMEDAVEYHIGGVNHTHISPKNGVTYASALRTLLRQDPDVIMVGEMRDEETLDIAMHAAMTGHLVLSAVDADSAADAMAKMVTMSVEPALVASATRGVVAQRLVRRLCPECRMSCFLNAREIKKLRKRYDADAMMETLLRNGYITEPSLWENIAFFKAKGCARCNHTGYRGYTGIFEVCAVSERIAGMMTQNATPDALMRQARAEGMVTMAEDGFGKAMQGITSVAEVMRVT